jgi:hypothetical protein
MRKPGLTFFLLLILAGVLAAGASGGQVYLISSLGPPHAIVVDGTTEDWTGALSYVKKDQLFVGFVNDREDLFICLTKETGERSPGAAMAGLTVWLDPRGGSKKTLGIRLAGTEGPPEGWPERRPSRKPEKQAKDEPAGQEIGEKPPAEIEGEIEILGPNGDVLIRLSPQEAAEEGLEVKSGISGGSFVLEVRIPLNASDRHPYAVGAGSDGIVGVGFIASRTGQGGRPGERRGGVGMPGGTGGIGGTMGGRSGMGGGMRGAMPANMNPDLGKTFKVWMRVRLHQTDQPARSTLLGVAAD